MNKKLISGVLLLLIIVIIASAYFTEINKADTEVPNINSHLQKANKEYNNAVAYLNVKNYTKATEHINTSYTEYIQAQKSAQKALDKAKINNKTIQIEYFTYTLNEIDYKINATLEMYNGLITVKNSPSQALKNFANSNKYMMNASTYSNKRNLLEEQYPDNFIK